MKSQTSKNKTSLSYYLEKICHLFYKKNILKGNEILACVQFGSSLCEESNPPNDIDLSIVVDTLPDDFVPRDHFKIDVVKHIADRYQFSFSINGIPEYIIGNRLILDLCLDSLDYINNKDPVSWIDIASKPYRVLFSKAYNDPYASLKMLKVSYIIKLSRIFLSINYIEKNLTIIVNEKNIDILIKQLLHCIALYTSTQYKDLDLAIKISEISYPDILDLIVQIRNSLSNDTTNITDAVQFFEEFKLIVKSEQLKISNKLYANEFNKD